MRSAIISYSNFLTSHHIPIFNKCFPVFTGGSFELFLKRTVKGAQTFKSTVKAELRDCIIGIFKSLTCISQPGIIQVLVEVFMECFRKNPGQNILADTQISGHAFQRNGMLKISGDIRYRAVDQVRASDRLLLNQLKFWDTSCQYNLQIRLDQCNVVLLCAENGIKCMINIRFYRGGFYYGWLWRFVFQNICKPVNQEWRSV